jgi:hypothetical protein
MLKPFRFWRHRAAHPPSAQASPTIRLSRFLSNNFQSDFDGFLSSEYFNFQICKTPVPIDLFDQSRLVHKWPVEYHDPIALDDTLRHLDYPMIGLRKRVDEGDFLIRQGNEGIVVAEKARERRNLAQLVCQLIGVLCHDEKVTWQKHFKALLPNTLQTLHDFVLRNKTFFKQIAIDEFLHKRKHALFLPADTLHDIPHSTTSLSIHAANRTAQRSSGPFASASE